MSRMSLHKNIGMAKVEKLVAMFVTHDDTKDRLKQDIITIEWSKDGEDETAKNNPLILKMQAEYNEVRKRLEYLECHTCLHVM